MKSSEMKENEGNSSLSVLSAILEQEKPCWYWDVEDLAHTPSHLEGLDPATEARYRQEGARFIFDIGRRLGLQYDTVATGITFFHRFYMFNSFKQFSRYVTGACSLFVAGKVEETPKRCKDVIKTARSLLKDVQFGQFGEKPEKELLVYEKIILRTIKLDLQVEHPYRFLLRYAKQLKGDKNDIEALVQTAWTFVNDSLCTTLCLQWEPEIIAVAVMYLAGRISKVDIQGLTSEPIWWEQFVQDLSVDILEDICQQILDLYAEEKQQMPQPKKQAPQEQKKRHLPASPKQDGKVMENPTKRVKIDPPLPPPPFIPPLPSAFHSSTTR